MMTFKVSVSSMMNLLLLMLICNQEYITTVSAFSSVQIPSSIKGRSSSSLLIPVVNVDKTQQYSSKSSTLSSSSSSSTTTRLYGALGELNNRQGANDWFYNLKSLPRSTVLKEIRNPVLSITIWSTILSIIQRILSTQYVTTSSLYKISQSMCVPHSAHSFLVSSLGLLLVFRTNSAYQRFLEGRKIWENILSISRNLSRMVTLYRVEVGTERLKRIKNLLAAYPYLLRHHIRSGCLCKDTDFDNDDDNNNDSNKYRLVLQERTSRIIDSRYEGDKVSGGTYTSSLQQQQQQQQQQQSPTATTTTTAVATTRPCYVDRRDLPWKLLEPCSTLLKVARSQNRPLWVCDRLGEEIMNIKYTPNYTSRERLSMLSSIDKLTNAIGQCERIHQTAVPLNYARHSLRSLTLWLFTLPFALIKDLGLLTGPVTGVVAWLLFGVYQIGHSIEDPFQGSLRLSMLCDSIRQDILGDDDTSDIDITTTTTTSRSSSFVVDEEDDDCNGWTSRNSAFNLKDTIEEQEEEQVVESEFDEEDFIPRTSSSSSSSSSNLFPQRTTTTNNNNNNADLDVPSAASATNKQQPKLVQDHGEDLVNVIRSAPKIIKQSNGTWSVVTSTTTTTSTPSTKDNLP